MFYLPFSQALGTGCAGLLSVRTATRLEGYDYDPSSITLWLDGEKVTIMIDGRKVAKGDHGF
jgi:hypothetical protein